MSIERLIVDGLGWSGAIILVVAYFLVSHGKWPGDSVKYNVFSIVASLLVGLNALYHGAIPSVGLNLIWMLIGVNALRLLRSRRRAEAGTD
ncbi:MAG: hypothetical protein R3F07_06360 [Opitutaceae bacterium]